MHLHQPIYEFGRANVLGVGVHAVNMRSAVETVCRAVGERRKGYICVTGVHGVMEAQRDEEFLGILNRAALVVPDGMPTVWAGRAQGNRAMARVFGPEFMLAVCRALVPMDARHFLYGGAPGVTDELKSSLARMAPGLKVVGTFTPPYRPLSIAERAQLEAQVRTSQPDIVWVGLSTPKQERFMAATLQRLETTLMIGVGAAFDFHTGRVKDAPQWIKSSGLQWLHRLMQDPKRLWRRYLRNNPEFVLRFALQMWRPQRPVSIAASVSDRRHARVK